MYYLFFFDKSQGTLDFESHKTYGQAKHTALAYSRGLSPKSLEPIVIIDAENEMDYKQLNNLLALAATGASDIAAAMEILESFIL